MLCVFFFFKQKTAYEVVSSDWSSDVCSSDLSAPLFFLPRSRCSSAPAFFTDHFMLRQHPLFLCCPFFVAAAPPLFILPLSRCSSDRVFYTAHFSLRQRPAFYTARCSLRQRLRFLYLPILAAAAPPLFFLPNFRCGSEIGRAHV